MTAWKQDGFALISDIFPPGGQKMPLLHKFAPGRSEVEYEFRQAEELPENLKTNIRIVPAILTFEG